MFHCSLSQQRGPSAALRYLRERERLFSKGSTEKAGEGEQEVLVLEGGFTQWQSRYGEDERLTRDYVKDIWMD